MSTAGTTTSAAGGLNLGLLGLSDRMSARTRKLLVAYALGETAYRVIHSRLEHVRSELSYSVAVASDDALYAALHSWLLDAMPPARRRALNVRSGATDPGHVPDSGGPVEPGLRLFYDAERRQRVSIAGHNIRVDLQKATFETAMLAQGDTSNRWHGADRLILTASSVAGRDAVIDLLHDLRSQQAKRIPRIRVAAPWGEWTYGFPLPARQLSTVVLRKGQREAIVADVEGFLASEADCVRLGIPWHRGYLLKGEPGSGKTSLAKALAGHLGLDVFYLSLSALPDDIRLAQLLSNLEPRSILVLEDIDIVHGSRERDDKSSGVTLAGLLNALDGFVTPHGLITIMTSNHASRLDPALIRPGRVDFTLELFALDADQLNRLVSSFCGAGESLSGPARTLMPADVVGALKDHLGDPAAGRAAVAALCNRRTL